MHFTTVLSLFTVVLSATLSSAQFTPVESAVVSLSDVFSPQMDALIKEEVGPKFYAGLNDPKCPKMACFMTLFSKGTCIASSIASKNFPGIIGCLGQDKLCQCLPCLPDAAQQYGAPICGAGNDLFAKVYMGKASDDEVMEAKRLGYSEL